MASKLRTLGFDLRQLEYFCAVARTGSFTKAAAELGIAQPSLSEQIARLEQGLGGALFERLSRRVELTALGHSILERARALLRDASALPECLDEVRREVRGPLRVGAIPTILPYYLPMLIRSFLAAFPAVELQVREATTAELTEQVAQGQMDVAVVSLPVEGALVRKELFRDPLLLAVPEDHPLAAGPLVQLRRLREERLILLKDGHCLRDETLSVCQRGRARFSSQFEVDQLATIFELVKAGCGVGIVPAMGRAHAGGCRLVDIEPAASRRIGYVRLERRFVPRPIEAFTQHLRAAAGLRQQPW